MLNEIMEADFGVVFDNDRLQEELNQHDTAHLSIAREPAVPIRDPLKLKRLWWILEFIPMRHTYQDPATGTWGHRWR